MEASAERTKEVVDHLNKQFKNQGKEIRVSLFWENIIIIAGNHSSALFKIIELKKTIKLKLLHEYTDV